MVLFLDYQGMWVLRDCTIQLAERGVLPSQRPGDVLLACFFVGINFHTKNKSIAQFILCNSITNGNPPQVHHDITCCHNFTGGYGEEADQDENRGGVCCKDKGWRDGG